MPVIQIGLNDWEMGKNYAAEIALRADLKETLAALIGVLGGVQALGPLGAFVGPIVVAFLQTLLGLLHREHMAFGVSSGKEPRTSDESQESSERTITASTGRTEPAKQEVKCSHDEVPDDEEFCRGSGRSFWR